MVDIKNIPAELKSSCRFCVWKFEKRNGQKTKMPYNPANGDRARINDLRTFADFKTTLVTYAMGGYDGIGIAVGSGIGAFDIDHCIREDGTLNDTADTVLSIFPTAYVEKSPSGKGLRGFSMCQRTIFTTRRSTTSTTAAKVWKCICPVRQTASSQ